MRKLGSIMTVFLLCVATLGNVKATKQDEISNTASLDTALISIASASETYEVTIALQEPWQGQKNTDVTDWFVNYDGSYAFQGVDQVATIKELDGCKVTITIDASKITRYTNQSDDYDLYIKLAEEDTFLKVGDYAVPVIQINSELFGSAYTYSKSTLKEALDQSVSYGDRNAEIALQMDRLDNSLINSEKASIQLINGDGYYAKEYVLKATTLTQPWIDGKTTYALTTGDLELDRSLYPLTDRNSGREWSCLGGDGSGNYTFYLQLSGITYRGLPLPERTFQAQVHIYGQNFVGLAGMTFKDGMKIEADLQTLSQRGQQVIADTQPVWTWIGAGEQPILCDALADDFYITWPAEMDASTLTKQQISISLTNPYGDVFQLNEEEYEIQTASDETQIAVTLLYLPNVPVYTQMHICVDGEVKSTQTYDIASVYVHETQQGGGGTTIDGTVTAYSFYGLRNLSEAKQIVSDCTYVLTYEEAGITKYYAEDSKGLGWLSENIEAAKIFDGNEDCNIQVIDNTAYITTRVNATALKTIGEQELLFTKSYSGGRLLNPSDTKGLATEDGYVLPNTNGWATHESWPWYSALSTQWTKGWTGIDVQPEGSHFTVKVEKGSSQQFTADDGKTQVNWSIVGETTDENTKISTDGILTIGENEKGNNFVIYAIAKDYHDEHDQGAVAINVIEKTVAVDKHTLQQVIETYQDVKEADYTKESYQVFQAAYEKAMKMLASQTVTQEEVDAMITELHKAYAALSKVEETKEIEVAVKQPSTPDTGDTTRVNGWILLSLLGLGLGCFSKRKLMKKENEE